MPPAVDSPHISSRDDFPILSAGPARPFGNRVRFPRGIGGLLAITEVAGASTNVFLPVCDQVGTVHALVAAVTNNVVPATPFVAARYEYSPYGELLEVLPDCQLFTEHGSLVASPPFGFQSKYRDAETGFWYFGYRFFDSRCAQWLTHDPLREEGGFNLAAFCGGDPVNQVDPWGLQSDEYAAGAFGFDSVEEFRQFMESGDGILEEALVGRMGRGVGGGGGTGFLRGLVARLRGGGRVKALPSAPVPMALLNAPAAMPRTRSVPSVPLPAPSVLHGDGFTMVRGPASFSTTGLYRPELAMRVRGGHLPRQALSTAVPLIGSRGASRTTFYVRPDGVAIPSVGYRAIGGPAVDRAFSGNLMSAAGPTYITFDSLHRLTAGEARSFLQLRHEPSHYATFNTLQIAGEVAVPGAKWNTLSTPEPFTSSFPEYGDGGARQAITDLTILDFSLHAFGGEQ